MTPEDGRLEFWEVRAPRSGELKSLYVRAAEVAAELGTTLPTDAELVDLMASGAADPAHRTYPRRPAGPTPA